MTDKAFPRALVRLKIEKDLGRYRIRRKSINLRVWYPTINGPYDTLDEARKVLAEIAAMNPGYYSYSDADGKLIQEPKP